MIQTYSLNSEYFQVAKTKENSREIVLGLSKSLQKVNTKIKPLKLNILFHCWPTIPQDEILKHLYHKPFFYFRLFDF